MLQCHHHRHHSPLLHRHVLREKLGQQLRCCVQPSVHHLTTTTQAHHVVVFYSLRAGGVIGDGLMCQPEATDSAAALPEYHHLDGRREQLQQHRDADTLPVVDADAEVVVQLIMFMYVHHHLAPRLHTLSITHSSPLRQRLQISVNSSSGLPDTLAVRLHAALQRAERVPSNQCDVSRRRICIHVA